MLILQNILSQEIVQRLGWTLLHFIWQAAAVALILTILLRLLRKSTANLRYIIACLALALIVLLPVITIKLVPVSQPLTADHFTPAPAPTLLPIAEIPEPETIVIAKPYQPESVTVAPVIPLKQRVADTLEPALPYIVSGWIIGVFALSIWHLGGWTQLQRLKRRMVKQVDSTLLNKLKVLTQKLKVKQTVQLMESALVQIPTVVGWLRPVILLPASALTGLNTEQLEAIIAHELAHIKRLDYLVNILQTVTEILGFYHPAVWWVSHKIRAERENCCDDMAVSISGDRVSYAGALASMEEIRASRGKLAVAASGGNLFRRICRLLGNDSTDNTGLSWVPAATAILLIIALAIPTTLALTDKSDSMLTEIKTDIQVEDDTLIATAHSEESQAADSKETADSQVEDERVLSAHKLKLLGLAVAMYADDHDRQLPDTLKQLKPYIANKQDYLWLQDNVEYALNEEETKYRPNRPHIPVAYDKTQKEKQSGANVLFLDGHVEFLTPQRLSELDIKRAKFLIEMWILAVNKDFIENINHNADSQDEAKELFELKSELLEVVDGSNKLSFIPPERNLNLLLKAVRAHKDSKVIAAPQVTCLEDKTAKIEVMNNETYYIVDYTEPNHPSEKPQPILEKVEEGIVLSLKPNLTPDKKIIMQFESVISRFLDSEERKFEGKAPYKPPKVQRRSQTLTYRVPNGQTFLFGGHKITDRQDGQTEQKDLLVLIKAHTIDSSKQVKPIKEENLIVAKPPATTINVITPPVVAKSRTERPEDVEREKTKSQIDVKKVQSNHKLKILGLAVAMYADDHDEILPHTLQELKLYIQDEDVFDWILDNVEYFDKGKTAQRNAYFIPIAYDSKLSEKADGTNVLFLDFSVRFVESKEFEKLDIKRAEFLIDARFLSVSEDFLQNLSRNADSSDEAKDLSKLKSELLTTVDGSNKSSFILPERNVSLLLKAVRAHKDSKVLAAPQVICQEDKTADIRIFNATHFISGYTEPNTPSEKPQPKFDKVEEGISLSVKPKLTPNKNIDMEYELEFIKISGFEEKMYKGKYPYKLPMVQAKNGQTLLLGIHKIADEQDSQTKQKDLFILITASTTGSSEQDKLAKAEQPVVVKPTRTTSKVIIPTATTPRRRVRPNDSELRKIEPVTERRRRPTRSIDDSPAKVDNKKQTVQIFKLQHHDISQMARIIQPLITKTGHISTDEKTNSLLISDTAENLKRIEKIIAAFDVLQADKTVQKFFKLKYYSPSQMGKIILPLVSEYGHVSADERTNSLLVIDTVENLKRIELIITEYDVPKVKVDETVTEIFEIRNGDPVEIVEILKKLINGQPDTASVIKPDTASVIESSNGPILLIPEPKRKWIIAKASPENITQIGQWIKKLDISKSTIGLDPIDKAVYDQLEMIVDLSELAPQMSFGEVVEILENSVEPPLQIQPIWKDLL
ncbi:MAG: secretin N-terminal domain-containing protein, partial [Planctomycetota bacterium]